MTTRMKPVVLLGMRKGPPFLQLVHSVGRFLGCPMEEDEYNGTYIGFLGDRKGTLNPTAIMLEEKLVGGWEKSTGSAKDLEIETFYSNESNRKKVYVPDVGYERVSVTIPHMPVVPSKYVQWLTEERRTPMELFNMILREFGAEEQDADGDEVKKYFQPVLNFCMMACQGKCNQQFNAVLDPSEDCRRWMTKRLEDTLGKGEAAKGRQRPPRAAPMASVRASRNVYEDGRRAGEAAAQKITTAPKRLKSWQRIQLMAWSGQTSKDDINELWVDLAEITEISRARQLITKAVMKAAKDFKCEISPIFLSDQTVKDIMKLNLSPSPVAEFHSLNEGITILEFLEKTPEEVIRLKRESAAQEDSSHTRTLSKSRKMKRNPPKSPPRSIYHMKELLATYAMFLRALFTKDCQHYKTVWEARRTLLALTTKVSKLAEETWSVLTWCIIDDARQFFSAVVDQSDFDEDGKAENLPTSQLVYHTTQLRMLQPFMPHDFPDQWRATTRQRLDDYKQPAGDTGGNKIGGGYPKEKDAGAGTLKIKVEPSRPVANLKETN